MTIALTVVIVLGGILTALVCKQTRRIATAARDVAHDAAQDAAGTRHAAEEALRRITDTQPPPAPPTQAIRLPSSWASLPIPSTTVTPTAGIPALGHLNGHTAGPGTQRIPRAGGTR